ncbi:MAG: aspartate kinase [Flavobacteriales bacterium]|nr:aspartate kinase [Flavobacteriales bacterium]
MQIKRNHLVVHKFGGASVKNSEAVRNVGVLLTQNIQGSAVVVVSAMGKTTNELEHVLGVLIKEGVISAQSQMNSITETHEDIARELGINVDLRVIFDSALKTANELEDADARYDALVAAGEDASTRVLTEYLKSKNFEAMWTDARDIILTDTKHRSARVNERKLFENGAGLRTSLSEMENRIVVTQGFIGRCPNGRTTTLGREGSDYSAALLACAIGAKEVVIWKDVPGMLNADPRVFDHTETIKELDYGEALELSYYGASVIHPRTIKPLQNEGIPLFVKSFVDLNAPQTKIASYPGMLPGIPMYISRPNVSLLSLGPADNSFVGEDHLSTLFARLNKSGIHVRMMQNSAVQFDLVFEEDPERRHRFVEGLGDGFWTKTEKGLELLTMRHGNVQLMDQLTAGKEVVMEQKSPSTHRRLLRAINV